MDVRNRYQYIDALRAIAVFAVIWTHIAEIYVHVSSKGNFSATWLDDISHEFDFGRIGVVTFFAISGFVIPSSFSGYGKEGAIKFIVSRFFRLFPAFWLSICLSLPLQDWASGRYPSLTDIALNFTMLPGFFGAHVVNGAYWTLELELAFYVACLFIFLCGKIDSDRLFALFSVLTGFIFVDTHFFHILQFIPEGTFRNQQIFFSIMFWGALCRRHVEGKLNTSFGKVVFWGMTIGWMFVCPMAGFHEAFVHHHSESDFVPRFFGAHIAGIAIFFMGIYWVRIENKLVAYLGKISYSIYLFQGAAMYGVMAVLQNYLPSLVGRLPLYFYLVAVTGLTVGFSVFSYRYCERPCIELGKRLLARYSVGQR